MSVWADRRKWFWFIAPRTFTGVFEYMRDTLLPRWPKVAIKPLENKKLQKNLKAQLTSFIHPAIGFYIFIACSTKQIRTSHYPVYFKWWLSETACKVTPNSFQHFTDLNLDFDFSNTDLCKINVCESVN